MDKDTLTWDMHRYHGTMDVQQERLNVYFNEVRFLIYHFRRVRLLVGDMSLGRSLSISNLGRWMLSKQGLLVTFSVPTTLSLDNLALATIGRRDSKPQMAHK